MTILLISLINTLWLAHVFVVLFLHGTYYIAEPTKIISALEALACLGITLIIIERIIHLRER
jgi:hypothetical protein